LGRPGAKTWEQARQRTIGAQDCLEVQHIARLAHFNAA
jgi:hypothetical protein